MKFWRDMLITAFLVLACGVVSGQATTKHATTKHVKPHARTNTKSAKKLRPMMVAHTTKSKTFHPVVKPYIPEKKSTPAKHARRTAKFHPVIKRYVPDTHKSKQQYAAARKRKPVTKKHVAKKHTVAKKKFAASHPVGKSNKPGKKKHHRTHHLAKRHVTSSHKHAIIQEARTKEKMQVKTQSIARKELAVHLVPAKETAGLSGYGHIQMANINLAENGRHELPLIPLKLAVTNLAVTDFVPSSSNASTGKAAMIEKSIKAQHDHPQPVAAKVIKASKSAAKKIKADAALIGRNQEIKRPKSIHVKEITSASVGVDPEKVNPSDAVHAIFMTVPDKKRPALANAAKPVAPNQRVASDGKDQSEKMIDKSEAAKQPVVKIVTADLSKNEFYILGENEPVPEYLATNPETQMVVFGGEMDEGAKKIMEFKVAALRAARARAAMELAEKTASVKAIAELEVEEKEATVRLMAAKKALDDMQQLKKWQMEKNSHAGRIVEKATSEYKASIVRAVVPEEIHSKELAGKLKDQLVPIEQVTVSAEKIADDLEGEISGLRNVALVKAVAVITKNKVARKAKSHSRKEMHKMAEKQINDAILNIKSVNKEKTVATKAIKKHAGAMKLQVAKQIKPALESIKDTAESSQIRERKNFVEKIVDVTSPEKDVKKSAVKVAKAQKRARTHIAKNMKKSVIKGNNVKLVPHELTRADITAVKSAQL